MKKILFSLLLTTALAARAENFTENFATDPAARGWQTFGDASLFHWDATNHNLAVTWDSSRSNSYFHHPLGTILANDDDFSVEFDLQLKDLAWNGTFQIAVGLLNFANATDPNFLRPVGTTPNLFEFDYFPDDGLGEPNLAASMTDRTATNTDFPNFYFIYDTLPLDTGATYHVKLAHTAGVATISGEVFTNGQIYTMMPFSFPGDLTDFRLDTISISSYSTNGDGFGDSILAHGTVANFLVTLPPPPVQNLTVALSNHIPQIQFISRTNWLYTLKRTADFISWSDVATAGGNGTNLIMIDTNAPADRAFYRVSAARP